ncbi:MAG: hypothetical protein H7Y20_10190 [Bryobacteraceae bacterium]|nr:hypothetical protein [Bryobacteraceae bacterium]
MNPPFFCSVASRERGERIFGTASPVERWILLEDRGSWNSAALPDRNLSVEVLTSLRRAARSMGKCRPLLIRRGHREAGAIHCFFVDSREGRTSVRRATFERYEQFAELDPEHAGELWTEPLFLVCTHGRHDKCCALFGIPVYRALRKVFRSQTWECTHVGGDRFAANLVCLPHGLYYGHLLPAGGVAVASAYQSGAMITDNYRGRSCYSKVAQVGEYIIRARNSELSLNTLRLHSTEQSADGTWTVRFEDSSSAELLEAFFKEEKPLPGGLLTCCATENNTVRQFAVL